jgi:CHAD domain-containing protein
VRFQLADVRLDDGVRRVVGEQVDRAVAELRGETERSRDEEVHEARKRCKRLRAVIRLVRDRIGHDVYRRENVAIRDAARRLSDVRDAQVLIETLDDVGARADGQLDPAAVARLRAALQAEHGRLRERTVLRGDAAEEAAAELAVVGDRSRGWDLDGLTFDDLRPGLERVYGRGRRRMREAYGDPTPERFHEWRKRVKYLWHDVELLTPAWPGLLDALAHEIHDLSDLLGDEHDRTVLGEVLANRSDLLTGPDAAALRAVLDDQRAALRVAAEPLGARVYAETPQRFSERLARYWDAARRQPGVLGVA